MTFSQVFIVMNKSYSKIRHIQEANSKLEKRVLGERKNSSVEADDLIGVKNVFSLFRLNSAEVKEKLSNIPIDTVIIRLKDCGFADFTGINLCKLPNLFFVNIEGTESNFDEQDYECATKFQDGKYDMKNEKPKKSGFSEPTSSTNMYGNFKYNLK